MLRINSHDSAFLRRILLLPFKYPIPKNKQDPDLRLRLEAERSGILFKALQAYRGLVARGYIFSGDDVYDFKNFCQQGEEIADQEETLRQFVQQHCVEAPDAFVTTDLLYERYQEFCKRNKREEIHNKQSFSSKFNALIKDSTNVKLTKKRVNGIPCNGYLGMSII
jgi:phage/plasmid-associated DNA primase